MNLQEVSKQIDIAYEKTKQDLQEELRRAHNNLDVATADCMQAVSQGDLSENTAYQVAKEEMAQANIAIASLTLRLGLMEEYDTTGYQPIGMVVLFSTVTIHRKEDNKEFTFKLFPAGISDVARRIISIDSNIGRAVWMKKHGDAFTILNRVTSELRNYEVIDIY